MSPRGLRRGRPPCSSLPPGDDPVMGAGRAKRHCRRCSVTPRPARIWNHGWTHRRPWSGQAAGACPGEACTVEAGAGHGHGVAGRDGDSRKRGSDPMQREDGRNGGTGAGQAAGPNPGEARPGPSRGPGSGHGHGVAGRDGDSRKRGSDPMQREDGRNGGTGAGQAAGACPGKACHGPQPRAGIRPRPWRCGRGSQFAKTRFRSHAT